jgi:hypothetical protein
VEEGSSDHVPCCTPKGIEDEKSHKLPVPINPCVYDF